MITGSPPGEARHGRAGRGRSTTQPHAVRLRRKPVKTRPTMTSVSAFRRVPQETRWRSTKAPRGAEQVLQTLATQLSMERLSPTAWRGSSGRRSRPSTAQLSRRLPPLCFAQKIRIWNTDLEGESRHYGGAEARREPSRPGDFEAATSPDKARVGHEWGSGMPETRVFVS